MSLTGNNVLTGSGHRTNQPPYEIDQSLRISLDNDNYLSRTFSTGNRKTWTASFWLKNSDLGVSKEFISVYEDSSNRCTLGITSDKFYYYDRSGGADKAEIYSDMLVRDPSAWYQIVLVHDSTESLAGDRFKVFVNGTQKNLTTTTAIALNQDGMVNKAVLHRIGQYAGSSVAAMGGYLAEFHFIDGTALTADSFGETDAATNQWKPIEVTGLTYGTNGFYQKYSATELAASFTDSSSSAHTITANGDVTNTRAQYKIGDSSIKFDGTGDYLSTPDSSDWDFGTGDFTLEGWIYCTDSSVTNRLFCHTAHGVSGQQGFNYYYAGDGRFTWSTNGTDEFSWTHASLAISDNTWGHIALTRTGQDLEVYANGVLKDSTTNSSLTTVYGGGKPLFIGAMNQSNTSVTGYWNGYMDEIRISDSVRYTTAFTPSTTPFVADSNTKLLIHSDFNGGLGADSSGNKNDFAVTNLVATDQMIDTPTNNYCTLNPLNVGGGSLSEGNLEWDISSSTGLLCMSSVGFDVASTTHKYYWEVLLNSGSLVIGIAPTTLIGSDTGRAGSYSYYNGDGDKYLGASPSAYGASFTSGDIIGISVGDGTIEFFKNNVSQGDAWTGLTGTFVPFISEVTCNVTANFGQDSSFAGNKTAQGNGGDGEDFYYTPPTGYVALSVSNLPDPAIALPTDHFNTVLWTSTSADGTSALGAVTGVGFQPDLVWAKGRTAGWDHSLFNSVMGTGLGKALYTNGTFAAGAYDTSGYGNVTSFDSDGFTVGLTAGNNYAYNYGSGTKYLAWNWKAGGTAVSNGDGSIPSSVSANTTAGFSIVSYTGNNTAEATIGHGLSQIPDWVIVKDRDNGSTQWVHNPRGALGANYYGYFTTGTFTADTSNVFWYDPTASIVKVSAHAEVNASSTDYIMYCFHSIEGYSKVGSYTGANSTDANFIYCGFKPAFVLLKNYGAAEQWCLYDDQRNTYNVVDDRLRPDSSAAEAVHGALDFVSNGFKIRSADISAPQGYIFYAVASSPFKTSNAR